HRLDTGVRRAELYELALKTLTHREVTKRYARASDWQLDAQVEEELRLLSVVAFAMFSRGTQWISEADLAADMTAVGGPRFTSLKPRTPLNPPQQMLSSFFLVRRSRALHDDTRTETYEFLHSTFAEY